MERSCKNRGRSTFRSFDQLAVHAVFLSHDLEISSRDLSKPHEQPIKTPESGAPAVVRLRFRFLR
eukprot:COSAG01_NODE_5154_length_4449_cov_2.393333_2_plen_65_part_00